jgi:hypothetical protein
VSTPSYRPDGTDFSLNTPTRHGSTGLRSGRPSGAKTGSTKLKTGVTQGWAAEALITAVDGNTVTLSKPLPKALAANTRVSMATLKYRPFSPLGTADYVQFEKVGWVPAYHCAFPEYDGTRFRQST